MQNLVETETKNLQKISKTLVEQAGRKAALNEQIPALQKVTALVTHTSCNTHAILHGDFRMLLRIPVRASSMQGTNDSQLYSSRVPYR